MALKCIYIVIWILLSGSCLRRTHSVPYNKQNQNLLNAYADAAAADYRRFKRALTTICVEIKPSSPQEEPYLMCKDAGMPSFPEESNQMSFPQPPVAFKEDSNQKLPLQPPPTPQNDDGNSFQNPQSFQVPLKTYISNKFQKFPTLYQNPLLGAQQLQQQLQQLQQQHQQHQQQMQFFRDLPTSDKFFVEPRFESPSQTSSSSSSQKGVPASRSQTSGLSTRSFDKPLPAHKKVSDAYASNNGGISNQQISTDSSSADNNGSRRGYQQRRSQFNRELVQQQQQRPQRLQQQQRQQQQPKSIVESKSNYSGESFAAKSSNGHPTNAYAKKSLAAQGISKAYAAPSSASPAAMATRPATATTAGLYAAPTTTARPTSANLRYDEEDYGDREEYNSLGGSYSSRHPVSNYRQAPSPSPLPTSSPLSSSPSPTEEYISAETQISPNQRFHSIDDDVLRIPNLEFSPEEFDYEYARPMTDERHNSERVLQKIPLPASAKARIPVEYIDDPVMQSFYASLDDPTPSMYIPIAPAEDMLSMAYESQPLQPIYPSPCQQPVVGPTPCMNYQAPMISSPCKGPCPTSPYNSYQQPQPLSPYPSGYGQVSPEEKPCNSCKSKPFSFQPIIIALPCYGDKSSSGSYPDISSAQSNNYDNLGSPQYSSRSPAARTSLDTVGGPFPGLFPRPRLFPDLGFFNAASNLFAPITILGSPNNNNGPVDTTLGSAASSNLYNGDSGPTPGSTNSYNGMLTPTPGIILNPTYPNDAMMGLPIAYNGAQPGPISSVMDPTYLSDDIMGPNSYNSKPGPSSRTMVATRPYDANLGSANPFNQNIEAPLSPPSSGIMSPVNRQSLAGPSFPYTARFETTPGISPTNANNAMLGSWNPFNGMREQTPAFRHPQNPNNAMLGSWNPYFGMNDPSPGVRGLTYPHDSMLGSSNPYNQYFGPKLGPITSTHPALQSSFDPYSGMLGSAPPMFGPSSYGMQGKTSNMWSPAPSMKSLYENLQDPVLGSAAPTFTNTTNKTNMTTPLEVNNKTINGGIPPPQKQNITADIVGSEQISSTTTRTTTIPTTATSIDVASTASTESLDISKEWTSEASSTETPKKSSTQAADFEDAIVGSTHYIDEMPKDLNQFNETKKTFKAMLNAAKTFSKIAKTPESTPEPLEDYTTYDERLSKRQNVYVANVPMQDMRHHYPNLQMY